MPDAAWKRWERRLAAIVRSKRTGPTGLDSADVIGFDGVAWEAKYRHHDKVAFDPWFNAEGRAAILQARLNAKGAPWAVALKDGSIHGPAGELVVLPMAYYQRLIKEDS
jgi:hypothetical protein